MSGISDKAIKSNYTENKYRFNKKELQNHEFGDGSGLDAYDYGARFLDPQLGMWHSPDPLNQFDYSYALDKEVSEDDELDGIRDDEDAMNSFKNSVNKFLSFLGPTNLTAGDAAIHYGESPYTYVLDNPLKYIDPLGLDTALPKVFVTGYTHTNSNTSSSGTPWWLGPALIGAGTRLTFLKPVGALGSRTGSSIASTLLSKAIPLKFTKVLGKKLGTQVVKKIGTNVVGRALGRAIPLVGVIWTLADIEVSAANHVIENSPAEDNAQWQMAFGLP